MSDGPATSADGISISMDELYAKAIDKKVAITTEEELEGDDEEVEQAGMKLESTVKTKKSKISKRKKIFTQKWGEIFLFLDGQVLCGRIFLRSGRS